MIKNLMRMAILIMILAMLSVMIEVLEIVGMMRAKLVVIMKVVMIVKIKDKDGERKFDCGDSNIDDGTDDGRSILMGLMMLKMMVIAKMILVLKGMMNNFCKSILLAFP